MRRRAGMSLAAPLLAGTLLLVLPACGAMLSEQGVGRFRNDRDLFAAVRTDLDCILGGVVCMAVDLPLSLLVDLIMLVRTIPAQFEEPPPKAAEPAQGKP
jgi:hypothetical protein